MSPPGMNPFLFYPQVLPPPPPPPPPPSSDNSFPILAISILGILTTAVLLLSYYIFVIKCCFNWHRSDVIARLSRSRRRHHHANGHLMSVYSIDIADQGLDESAIQAIPTHRFRKEENNSFHECAVCLNEFQEEERIRLLPNCFHVFHIDCIDTWLQTHANCPLCRCTITSPCPIQTAQHLSLQTGESVVIEVIRDSTDQESDQAPRTDHQTTSNTNTMERKLNKVSSMGDECIDVRVKDEQFSVVQPMRRSFSMDSSSDRQLYLAVQEILQQNPHFREACNGEGSSSSSGGSGRNRRSFFSFSHCRSSRSSAVLPVKNEI